MKTLSACVNESTSASNLAKLVDAILNHPDAQKILKFLSDSTKPGQTMPDALNALPTNKRKQSAIMLKHT